MLHRNRGDGELTKTVEAIVRDHPDVAFPILEESVNQIPRQTVGLRKQIHSLLVHMREPLANGPNPQTTVAIPEHSAGLYVPRAVR